MKHPDELGQKKIPKLLFKFAVPSIFSLVLHAMYNVVDRAFIGQKVGALGLAGVTFSFPIMLIIFGFCLLFSNGGASLISLCLGEKKKEQAEHVLGNTMTLITGSGILITIVGVVWGRQILALFQVPDAVFPYAWDYCEVIFFGILLFLYGFSMTFIIRAEGNPMYATAMIVVGTILNVILDYTFIFGLDMGTRGAALATVLSEACVACMGLFYIISKKGVLHIRAVHLILKWETVKRIALLGMAAALMNVMASVQLSLANERLITIGGPQAVAAMGIVFSINSIIMLFTFGMAAGMQPIIGYNYGARQFDRVRQTIVYACSITFVISIVFIAGILIGAEYIVRLFAGSNEELVALSCRAMRIFVCAAPFTTMTILSSRYFQSIGKGITSTVITLNRQLLFFVPMLYILSKSYGLNGIWFTGPVTDLCAVVLASILLIFSLRKLTN
ncbi:MAG: MATE family efflux transporter [Candidatus Omnitrophica bacterium]|nr:MATE family efflux transporter [Candidatus Omnitrophota bacterium]